MRTFFLIAFSLSVFSVSAQYQKGLAFQSGLNRIGVHFDPTFRLISNKYELDLGFRMYGMDQVFEKPYPGLLVRNGYHLRSKKGKIGLGLTLTSALFFEKKSGTNLVLFDFMMTPAADFYMKHGFVFCIKPGLGWVNNILVESDPPERTTFTYLNYEFALALKYTFSSSSDK